MGIVYLHYKIQLLCLKNLHYSNSVSIKDRQSSMPWAWWKDVNLYHIIWLLCYKMCSGLIVFLLHVL